MSSNVSSSVLKSEYETYLSLDPKEYRGQWVALLGGKVIAHGNDPKKVYDEANNVSKKKPFMLTKITATAFEAL
ncbi:hypothetical protein HY988_07275 [Candidatus Micrarchaeota archaeon]|nr:hypothetical protein [Candidatus Micrarchaeota archaeon]